MINEQLWNVIVNSNTCKPSRWRKWERKLIHHAINYSVVHTQTLAELSDHLQEQIAAGQKHFLFAGGDGTIHHGGNLILHLAGESARDITIGVLPCGTGNDWFKTFGVDSTSLIESLRQRKSMPLHILKLEWPDGAVRYAMNMTGGAIDAAVVDQLNTKDYRFAGFLKYPFAVLKALSKPHIWPAQILVDDHEITGDWLTFEAGFGKYCGGGMYMLPHAESERPALLLMKKRPLYRILASMPKIYNGNIGNQKEAITMHFSKIKILETPWPFPLEADGEWLGYGPVTITPVYGMLQRLFM